MNIVYFFVVNHLSVIVPLLVAGLIPDYIFRGCVPAVHAAIIAIVIIIMLVGMIFRYDEQECDSTKPCIFCTEIDCLPESDEFHGFAIHDGAMWFSDSEDGWVSTPIDYCPMCGRKLEDNYVQR